MRYSQAKHNLGLTLIEIMVVVFIIAVAVLGAMGFRFYCVTDAKKADVQVNAARIGSMILENWKGMGGPWPYDPAASLPKATYQTWFVITKISATTFQIKDSANSVYYDIGLSYTGQTLPASNMLNVSIRWRQGYGDTGTTAHTISVTTYAD